jgi:type VI secretion system protein ImpA
MPSPEVLEFATLLAPIPGDKSVGEDLRADSSPSSPYYAVKDARSAARAAERQIDVEGGESDIAPDWKPVLTHGTRALTEKSKDLEIVAYMIEALVRLNGFPGLRDGYRLVRELVEQYWDGLYPLPDEEGMVTRVAPLTGLNGDDAEGTLINPLTKVPLTEGSSVGPFAYYHYQQAAALGRIQDENVRQQRAQRGGVLPEVFDRAVAETPAPFFRTLVEDINAAQEEFAKLCNLLEEKCGSHAPPSSNIRATLTTCLETVNTVARDKLATLATDTQAPAEGEEAAAPGADGAAEGAGPRIAGVIQNREDALNTLVKVADFFRRTEPHTPVSYLLEQAVRWGRMSLPELLAELIPDEAPRLVFFKQVGIRPPPPPPQ